MSVPDTVAGTAGTGDPAGDTRAADIEHSIGATGSSTLFAVPASWHCTAPVSARPVTQQARMSATRTF